VKRLIHKPTMNKAPSQDDAKFAKPYLPKQFFTSQLATINVQKPIKKM
jgi:hypothetical protein